MTLAEIKEQVDHISETWRDNAPGEQHANLADLDTALAELDELEPETEAAADAVDQLRGRIEVLMDEIDITLGIEPSPIDVPGEVEDLEPIELVPEEEEEALFSG